MKKILVSAILGLAAIASVQAQSTVQLYSYNTPTAGGITYGLGAGPVGNPVSAGGYTVGLYWALGDVTAAVNSALGGATTQGGANAGTLVGSGLTLGTGIGSTGALGTDGNNPGDYANTASFTIPGLNSTATVTLVLVAYNGAS